ncbi:rod-binding protein [Litorivivens sp.]|uniref:rod-binding protein n=1 Tax=Litorivivens sp. TaxID=2020868 RepID=UPI003567AF99
MNLSGTSYHDFSGFAQMRAQAKQADSQATQSVAKQFESLFVQMMLKEMRDTLPEGGLFTDQNLRFYQDMLDKELSQSMVEGDGMGLAPVIERQLGYTPEASALEHTLHRQASSSSLNSR